MNNVVNWNLTLSGSEDIVKQIDELPTSVHDELSRKIALLVQETLGLTSLDDVQANLSPVEMARDAVPHQKYDASEYLVQLITSDFEGSLYPFALALGQRVEAYIKHLQQADALDKRLHTLDTEMHQMMTEIARHYARTGNWQMPD